MTGEKAVPSLLERLEADFGRKDRSIINSLRAEIADARAQGYNNREIWHLLSDSGAIKCSYRTFCAYVKNHKMIGSTESIRPSFKEISAKKENSGREQPHAKEISDHGGSSIKGFVFERLSKEDLI